MGTRGAIGFRIDDEDKLSYNHWDSYPEGLGADLLAELCGKKNWDLIAKRVRKIVSVSNAEPPTPEQIEANVQWANLGVSDQKLEDWYCLLRKAQGTLRPYMTGALPVMYDANQFVLESLFCEYAYIVNRDNRTIEFYRGFNEEPLQNAGRYAGTQTPPHVRSDGSVYQSEYYGVVLVDTVKLAKLPQTKAEAKVFIDRTIRRWSRKASKSKEEARSK